MEIAANEILFNIELFSSQSDFGNLIRLRPALSYLKPRGKLLHQGKKAENLLAQSQSLVRLADLVYAQRRFELLEYVGTLLLQGCPGAGQYYLALAAKNKGFIEESLHLLEKAGASNDLRLRAKAFSTIGAILLEQNKLEESFWFRLQALRFASSNYCEPLIIVEARRAIAILKSINGDHCGAVADLEKLLPAARLMGKQQPVIYYDVLNSLAVELGEVGRIDEGCGALNIALASPFVVAYPEWLATRAELIERGRRASRSLVAVGRLLEEANVLPFDFTLAKTQERLCQGEEVSGSIQHIDDWKMNTKQTKKEPGLTTREKQAEIINTVLDCNDQELDAVREFLKTLHSDSKDASES
jgi:hypothetical protein